MAPFPLLQLLSLLLPLLLITSFNLPFCYGASARAHRHHPPARPRLIRVRGTALCDSCQQNRLSYFSLPISGATISLACRAKKKHIFFLRKAISDKQGGFAFDLPFSKPSNLRRCKVELTSSPFEGCNQHTRSGSIKMLAPAIQRFHSDADADADDLLTYSAGWLSVQPKRIPSFCNKFGLKKDVRSQGGFSSSWFPPTTTTPPAGFPFNFFGPNNPFSSPPSTFPNLPWFPPAGFPNFPWFPFPFSPPTSGLPLPPPFPNFPPFDLWSPPSPSSSYGWQFPPTAPTTTFPSLPPAAPAFGTPTNPTLPQLPPLPFPPTFQVPSLLPPLNSVPPSTPP